MSSVNSPNRSLWRAVLSVAHGALVVVLIAIAVPELPEVVAQLGSDYVPDYMALVVGLIALPLGLTIATLVGLAAWLRRSTRWLLLATDVVTLMAAWSVLTIFVMGGDLPILLVALAPACLVLAITAAARERRRDLACGNGASSAT